MSRYRSSTALVREEDSSISLHDIDKHTPDRGDPSPNKHDELSFGAIPSHGTNSVNYTTDVIPAGTNDGLKPGFKRQVVTENILVTWLPGGGSGSITVSSYIHGLTYTPLIEAAINNANAAGLTGVSVPLPSIIAATVTATTVGIQTYMEAWADKTNLYVLTWNANGQPSGSLTVTYYLYQQGIPAA